MDERHPTRQMGAKARVGSKGMVGAALALIMVMAALGLAWPRAALAAPDPPIIDRNVAFFEGNQSLGIIAGRDFDNRVITELWIRNLDRDISPAAGPGVNWWARGNDGVSGGDPGSAGPKLTLRYFFNNDTHIRPGGQGEGIAVQTQGGNGQSGSSNGGVISATGGDGGAGGAGGDLSVIIQKQFGSPPGDPRVADISSQGAAAISAKSTGGGGNSGGNGTAGINGRGGDGGNGGNGGRVFVYNEARLSTTGDNAQGILAVSKGSSGGGGGKGKAATYGKGGNGGNGGAGGVVQVICNGGEIVTNGKSSSGIWALSQGGGGGKGGSYTATGGSNGSPGAGGAGGEVNVSNINPRGATPDTNITTRGDQSHGILAQSLGSFGGGNGGNVLAAWQGNIQTGGAGSSGIMAQSLGYDKAGAVNVFFKGNITASGYASHGIDAQSLGMNGNGNISVIIDSGSTVQGGRDNQDPQTPPAPGSPNYSYGVLFRDGAANALANYGTITTAGGVNGTAIMQQWDPHAPGRANLTVDNYGTITGSVNQGSLTAAALPDGPAPPMAASTITFNNNNGATFNTGRVINLGAGTLANRGTLNIGGGTALQSNLTGNFFQDHTAYFQTMLNGDGTGGSLKVSGSTQLDGTLQVFKGAGIFLNGKTYDILTSSQNITTKFSRELLPTPTALVSFTTNYLPNSIQVVSHVKSFTSMAGDSSFDDFLGIFDTISSTATGDLATVIAAIQGLQPQDFNNLFSSLTPDIYDANTITTFNITRQYLRNVQRRLQTVRQNPALAETAPSSKPVLLAFNGANRQLGQFLGDGQDGALQRRIGFWLEGFHQWGNAGGTDGFSGFNFGSTGTAAGLDYALTERVTLGANFGYSYTSMNLDTGFGAGRINSLYGSLYGTALGERSYLGGIPYLEGILCYGHHDYKNNRLVRFGTIERGANSDHQGNSFSVFTEAGYAVPVQRWAVQPFASLLFTHLAEGSIQETGADSLNMQIDGRQTNLVVSEMGLRLARPIKTSKGTLTPEVKAAWQHDFGVDKRTMPLSFAGIPTGLAVDGQKLTQDSATVSAALSFISTGGITTTLKYDGEFRSGYKSHGVLGEVRLSF